MKNETKAIIILYVICGILLSIIVFGIIRARETDRTLQRTRKLVEINRQLLAGKDEIITGLRDYNDAERTRLDRERERIEIERREVERDRERNRTEAERIAEDRRIYREIETGGNYLNGILDDLGRTIKRGREIIKEMAEND